MKRAGCSTSSGGSVTVPHILTALTAAPPIHGSPPLSVSLPALQLVQTHSVVVVRTEVRPRDGVVCRPRPVSRRTSSCLLAEDNKCGHICF